MKKILLVRGEKAFLPEIDAYLNYLNAVQGVTAFDSSTIDGSFSINEFDVIWEFKGLGGMKVKDQLLIHEYASLSTGIFPTIKNGLKARINPKPDLRIFLNARVRNGFPFNDEIDYCYRDMGIDESFLQQKNNRKEYDFIYVGAVSKDREIDKLLNKFVGKNNGKLCLIGNVENEIYNDYKENKNLIFTGKIPYHQVPKIASKGVYGINYIPDKYPYNIQTSTKLLEYLALDLKVITTDYRWVREFEKENECKFYKISNEFDFDLKKLQNYKFKSGINMNDYLWGTILEKSNIMNKIISIDSRKKFQITAQ
ncbi:glycosyltransferase [Evansella tamaricis]|uniref:Glycosyltransferase n=1 Tax=Evansella tamaricis TaxID=2069301 RepID=A0ABS6JET7_9BACI|nr:glycosyltransferase [Evansella tamaricis]MBU9712167.1 glycosyltransferase [Evansella tamaricis]